ncbi:MAG: WYL domain-containing protein, partial [Chroococcales cyanobacterium]
FIGELEGDPPIRRVLRDIYSTFWFFRDIGKYWEDCVIVSPDSVRDRFLNKLQSLNQRYQS